jgi:steroid delta-isomerase-like uncharacterized protein
MKGENKAIVQRFYDEVVNQGDLSVADELLRASYVEHGNPERSGLDGFKRFAEGLVEAFPDLKVHVAELIAEGDRVVARVTVTGTHRGTFMGTIAATGRSFTMGGVDIFEIEEGQIAGRWNQRDLLGLMLQLSVVSLP